MDHLNISPIAVGQYSLIMKDAVGEKQVNAAQGSSSYQRR